MIAATPRNLAKVAKVARRLDPITWVAVVWGFMALGGARRQLARNGLNGFILPRPPPLPRYARRGVVWALRRGGATCLMEAVVLQRWDAAHGWHRDVVIGVTVPSEGFQAHAWLDGDLPCHDERFRELIRHSG